MSNRAFCYVVLFALLLVAGCGPAPTATPAPITTPAAYPPPQTIPTLPPPTPDPTMTPEPTPDLAPQLVVQPVPEELRAGERIAFLRDSDLWLVRPDGSSLSQVSTSANVSAIFGWSWDNSRLLLGVTGYGTGEQCGYPGWVDLWVLPMDGSSPQQITQGQTVTFAIWSPVNRSLAYTSEKGHVYLPNLEMGTSPRIAGTIVGGYGLDWSPDGTRLALVFAPPNQDPGGWLYSSDVGVWNLKDGTITNLTNTNDDPSPIQNSYPIWSLDGSRILFESDRLATTPSQVGSQRWYVIDSSGGGNLKHLDTLPSFSALNTTRSPAADLVVMNLGGEIWLLDFQGHMNKLADSCWPCWSPYSWSPDGTQLALVKAEGQLVRIDLHSLAIETIAETGNNPTWTR